MTKTELIAYINAWIKDNNNKEITAAIMRDVLDKIVQFIDDNVGEVQDLVEGETVIGAINLLFQMFEDLDVVHPVNKFSGSDNPNNVPPSGYNVGDLYVRNGNQLYQYNGNTWVRIVDSAGGIRSIVAGENVSVDNSDPLNPVINANEKDVQWNEITGDQSDILLSGFTNDLPSQTLEVYSESGTLAGGDAVATIGDIYGSNPSGLMYQQNEEGYSYFSLLTDENNIVSISSSATSSIFTGGLYAGARHKTDEVNSDLRVLLEGLEYTLEDINIDKTSRLLFTRNSIIKEMRTTGGGTGYELLFEEMPGNYTSIDIHFPNKSGTIALENKEYTVATLPSTPSRGDKAFITDATAPTYLGVAVGGGSVFCEVMYNGTDWVTI